MPETGHRLAAIGEKESREKTQAQLKTFIRHAPVSIAMFDRNMNYLATSERWVKENGKGYADLTGRNHYQLNPDLPERWKEVHRQGMAGATVKEDEELWVESDGTRHWLRWAVLPWSEEDGAIGGIILSVDDITESKLVEEELRESEQRYSAIFENSPFAAALTATPEGVIVAVNDAFLRLFEYTREDVLGKTPLALGISNLDAQRQVRARLQESGSVRDFQNTVNTKSGLPRILSLNFDYVSIGGARYVLTTIQDITKRKHAEEALRATDQLLAAELDGMTRLQRIGSLFLQEGSLEPVLGEIVEAAIAVSGSDFGNIQILNEASDLQIVAHRGFPQWWVDFWNNSGRGQGACATAKAQGERVIIEDVQTSPVFIGRPALEIQTRAGVRAVQSTPLISRSGKLLGMFSTHYKSPKRPDDRALRMLDLLARQAADIIEHAQAREMLQSANSQLIEADRRKDEFIAVLSHELRNPLAPITNSLYVLDHVAPGSVQAQQSQTVIKRQVEHMTRLIEDLLDVTRIIRGKAQLQRERLDLNDLAQHTIEDHRGGFVRGEIDLVVQASPEKIWVDGDRTRLSQVIGNLLQNAVKFTPRGGKTTVSIEKDSAKGRAVVRVQDTGRGIAPEILPRVYEAFVQADATLDRGMGGLGLGLALVKGLVEMHGGSVNAESGGSGKGATFTITMPLQTSPPNAPHMQPIVGPTETTRRVLIIEDNADAACSLRQILEMFGNKTEVAHSGSEGIEKARSFAPDVVICDIGLPEMDGYAVARALRADPAFRRMLLVALSGYAQPEDVARGRNAGFDAYLAKPLNIEALEKLLSSC